MNWKTYLFLLVCFVAMCLPGLVLFDFIMRPVEKPAPEVEPQTEERPLVEEEIKFLERLFTQDVMAAHKD